MKGACFQAIESVACRDIPDPQIEQLTDAIVKVSLAGLCGSDLHVYFGREAGADVDMVMGHELVGTVVETGSEVQGIQVGDRVYAPFTTNCGKCFYCNRGLTARCEQGQLFGWVENGLGLHGGQSEFVRVPLADGTLKKIPSTVSDASALLLGDNFSAGFYCAEMAEIQPDRTYVVVGCGTASHCRSPIANGWARCRWGYGVSRSTSRSKNGVRRDTSWRHHVRCRLSLHTDLCL